MDDVTIIIVTFNSAGVLERCFEALPKGARIIVVDNGSTDNSVGLAEKAGCTIVSLGENRGYGTAANRGIEVAETKYVFLINPDIALDRSCMEVLTQAAERYPGAAVLGPRQTDASGNFTLRGGMNKKNKRKSLQVGENRAPAGDCCVDFLVGSALFMNRQVFNNVGGFDENIFLFYEENDLCDRVRAAGHGIIFVNDALAVHHIGSSTDGVSRLTAKKRWHMAWSKQYVRRKNKQPSKILSSILGGAIKVAFAFITRNQNRQRYWGQLTGTIDFLRGVRAQDKRLK